MITMRKKINRDRARAICHMVELEEVKLVEVGSGVSVVEEE